MSRGTLQAEPRELGKTTAARNVRRSGLVPGIVYGHGEAIAFQADEVALTKLMRANTTLVEITVNDESHMTVIKEYQVHPVRGTLTHVDLQTVRSDEKIKMMVNLELHGVPVGLKNGGILSQLSRDVQVQAFPQTLPEKFDIDVTDLNIGDAITVADLAVVDGVEIMTEPDTVIASVSASRATLSVAEEEAEAAEATESGEAAATAAASE